MKAPLVISILNFQNQAKSLKITYFKWQASHDKQDNEDTYIYQHTQLPKSSKITQNNIF